MFGGPYLHEYGTWLAQSLQVARRDINGNCAFNSISLADPSGLLQSMNLDGGSDYLFLPKASGGGWLLQAGIESGVPAASNQAFTLPEAFAGASNYWIVACYMGNGLVGNACSAYRVGAGQAGVVNSTASPQDIFWIAVGEMP